jgi:hypothetical protein
MRFAQPVVDGSTRSLFFSPDSGAVGCRRFPVPDLCERLGISRKTGYKHLERYAELGLNGPRSPSPPRPTADGARSE